MNHGAGNEIRTRDLNLGKVALYQLSYSRICIALAEWTGLEPATPGVTGRYSNQLNYHSKLFRTFTFWLLDLGSNQGPTD
jgi:hypothetical protein